MVVALVAVVVVVGGGGWLRVGGGWGWGVVGGGWGGGGAAAAGTVLIVLAMTEADATRLHLWSEPVQGRRVDKPLRIKMEVERGPFNTILHIRAPMGLQVTWGKGIAAFQGLSGLGNGAVLVASEGPKKL